MAGGAGPRDPTWGSGAGTQAPALSPAAAYLRGARVLGLFAFVFAEAWQLLWAGGSEVEGGMETQLLFLGCWLILAGYAACVWGTRAGLAIASACAVGLAAIVVATASMGAGGGLGGSLFAFGPTVALVIGITVMARIRRRREQERGLRLPLDSRGVTGIETPGG